jgi:hypothetical protein
VQIYIGKVVLFLWALLLAFVGYLLVMGQGAVVMTALEAGRISEAIMQSVFITVVAVTTIVAVFLFFYVGILRE